MKNLKEKELLYIINIYQNYMNDFINITDKDLSTLLYTINTKGGFTKESQEAWSKMTTAQRIEKTKDERRVFPKGSAPYQRLSKMISVLEELSV